MDEFSIIDKYFSGIGFSHDAVTMGPGDDCAVFDLPSDCELCVSTDTMLAGVHFPQEASGDVVADRTLTANLSDLAAMGASPVSFLLSLTMPNSVDSWLADLANKLSERSQLHGISLSGGNLAKGPLSVTITVMGTVPTGMALMRRGSKVGDHLYVTGELGAAAAGLRIVQENGSNHRTLRSAYLHPQPRLVFAQGLRGIASACIDISDGFLANLNHVCTASSVGAEIDTQRIFLSDELRAYAGDRALEFSLHGGDDYELCFSASESFSDDIVRLGEETETLITRVGTITAEPGVWLADDGVKVAADIRGYTHF